MPTIKVSEATGVTLDWLVAKCENHLHLRDTGWTVTLPNVGLPGALPFPKCFSPSTRWAQGGPIVEREAISLTQFSDYPKWTAKHPESLCVDGPTPLIAAMRCYVASKLGEEVEVPEGLS